LRPDGTFHIDGVAAGTGQLKLCYALSYGAGTLSAEETLMRVTAVDGEATRVEADLASFMPCEVDATLWLNGRPLANERVMLVSSRGGLGNNSDAEGHLRVLAFPGTYRLQWLPRDNPGLYASSVMEFTGGVKAMPTVMFASGELHLRLRDVDGSPQARCRVQVRPADRSETLFLAETDEDGSASAHLVPGTYHCMTLPRQLLDPSAWRDYLRSHPNDWQQALMAIGDVEIKQGSVTSVELRVPGEGSR
jgi:hypothetical protein